jgi:hypothetical protein
MLFVRKADATRQMALPLERVAKVFRKENKVIDLDMPGAAPRGAMLPAGALCFP